LARCWRSWLPSGVFVTAFGVFLAAIPLDYPTSHYGGYQTALQPGAARGIAC